MTKAESGNKKRIRSSSSGQYTNKEAALANPSNTVSETPKRRADIKSAVTDFIKMKSGETDILVSPETLKAVLTEFALFYSKRKPQ